MLGCLCHWTGQLLGLLLLLLMVTLGYEQGQLLAAYPGLVLLRVGWAGQHHQHLLLLSSWG
jgi:hypothetical protein